jgi:adenylate cyclase
VRYLDPRWYVRSSLPTEAHTFLFMDLVGFTALTAERGDDGAAEVALRFYGQVRKLLPEHCGEEIKTIGDAMMVRCEDPCQGIALGLGIADQMDAAAEFPPVRIGVHTGSAVCRDGDWYGSAVNVAARLCAAAGGGDVLVSEATLEAAGSSRHVELGDRELHWLKNVPEPVPARLAFRHECPGARRPMRALKRLVARRPVGAGVPLRRSEATG